MAQDSNLQSTGGGNVAVASETIDPNRSFSGYKQLVAFSADAHRLHDVIDKQTEVLAEAKKAPSGEFQRAHIHQINNILFRSSYELDQIHEEYRRVLSSCIEELQIDWTRMKSNWVQDENQLFLLQVLLAKSEFLKQNAKDFAAAAESLPPLETLLDEINRFTSAHLSSGTLPDSCLESMSQMVGRLVEVLTGAYELATENPPWRGSLTEPKEKSLSAPILNEALSNIKNRIEEIPSDISKLQRLLPSGNWRAGDELRPEIYALAEILYPDGPLQKLAIRDTLLYLDNNPDSRLRRGQMDKLKSDADRCKYWLEIREKHELLLEQAVGLAKEGNYIQAEEFIGQTSPLFSDVNYQLYRETAKFWLDQAAQLKKRLEILTTDLEERLKVLFGQPYIPVPRTAQMKRHLTEASEAFAKELKSIEKYSQTDFYREVQPAIQQTRSRIKELEQFAIKKRSLCRSLAFTEAGVLAALMGGFLAMYLYSIESTVSTLTVEVTPGSIYDSTPNINLGPHHQKTFLAKFLEIAPGNYPLTIDEPGYYSKSYQIVVEPGKNARWGPIKLDPISGALRLQADHAGYDFRVCPLKETGEESDPVAISQNSDPTLGHVKPDDATAVDLRPGRYRVHFFQGTKGGPDAKEFDSIFEVRAHQVTSYLADFTFATLEIHSDPEGADVSIDGKTVGKTPFVQRLAPLDYSLAVSRDHYESYYAPLHLAPGSRLPLSLHLKLKPVMPITDLEGPASDAPNGNNSN